MTSSSRRFAWSLAVALAAALAPAAGQQASACSCMLTNPSQEFGRADVVFYGRVVQQRVFVYGRGGGIQTTMFRAGRVWKGPSRPTFELTTYTFGPGCGFTFAEGEDYLVYAYDGTSQPDLGPGLWTNICSGTSRGDTAAVRMRALGPGIPIGAICPQIAVRLPRQTMDAALSDPWTFGGWGRLADEGRPPSPYNPERTWLSLRNPHAPLGPMNAPIWKAYCP